MIFEQWTVSDLVHSNYSELITGKAVGKNVWEGSMMFRQKKIRQGSLGKSIFLPKTYPPKVTAQTRVLGNSMVKPGALAMQPRF